MSHFFGVLSVFTFVVLPNGRERRVTLAAIPCEYAERESALRKFVDDNVWLLKARMGAEFVVREPVLLLR